jgi:hypothetical protein
MENLMFWKNRKKQQTKKPKKHLFIISLEGYPEEKEELSAFYNLQQCGIIRGSTGL